MDLILSRRVTSILSEIGPLELLPFYISEAAISPQFTLLSMAPSVVISIGFIMSAATAMAGGRKQ